MQVDERGAFALLGIEPGQEVVIRKRLQLLDGVPAVISTSYYPMWVAEGTRLESADALPEGPDNLIEQLGTTLLAAWNYCKHVCRLRMKSAR